MWIQSRKKIVVIRGQNWLPKLGGLNTKSKTHVIFQWVWNLDPCPSLPWVSQLVASWHKRSSHVGSLCSPSWPWVIEPAQKGGQRIQATLMLGSPRHESQINKSPLKSPSSWLSALPCKTYRFLPWNFQRIPRKTMACWRSFWASVLLGFTCRHPWGAWIDFCPRDRLCQRFKNI